MRPLFAVVGPLTAASPTNIRTASAGVAGALVLNGALVTAGVAALDKPRRILITNAADETGKTITLIGTGWAGQALTEVITLGGIGSTSSVLDFQTITSATLSANSAGNLSIGTTAIAASNWVRFDDWVKGQIGIQVEVAGTVNYTLQQSMNDPNSPWPLGLTTPQNMVWFPSSDAAAVGAVAGIQSNYMFAPSWARVLLNSGTGSLRATYLQSGER